MRIQIDIDDSTPLFAQVMAQIKKAVASGGLTAGSPLPSIRQLASDLEINNKTVAKAYRLLERDHVIQTKGYRGTFIHPSAVDNCSVDLKAWAAEELSKLIRELRNKNVTDSEIRIAFSLAMNFRQRKGN